MTHTYTEICETLLGTIPQEEYRTVMSQKMCELSNDFLGFVDIYQNLSKIIPQSSIVIDFGCYLAAQSYFFAQHRGYIGVDIISMQRFSPPNAVHFKTSIQKFIETQVQRLFQERDPLQYFAICSFVPDSEAVELVRKTFPNVFCYYPSSHSI